MDCLNEYCWVCLNNEVKLKKLTDRNGNEIEYHSKLTETIPEMNTISKEKSVCELCCKTIDDLYKFRKKCLHNRNVLERYFISLDRNVSLSDFKKSIEEVTVKIEPIVDDVKEEMDDSEDADGILDEYDENAEDPLAEEDAETNRLPFLLEVNHSVESMADIEYFNHCKTEKGTYKCDQCNKEIRSVYYFRVHRQKHFSDKIFTCDECQKSFADHYTYKKHKELVHAVERPYICTFCSKTYKTKSDLTRHEMIHTGETPYFCEICHKSFRHSSSFARHKRIHSGIKPHVCEFCEKGFGSLGNLRKHKRIHTGERPYVCNICNKTFSCGEYLNTHKNVHNSEKTYECDVCKKLYKSKATLKQHRIGLHGLKTVKSELISHVKIENIS